MRKAFRLGGLNWDLITLTMSVVDPETGDLHDVIYDTNAKAIIDNLYSDRLFLYNVREEDADIERQKKLAVEFFEYTFALWFAQRETNITKAFCALTFSEYNPVENYDRYEEGGWTDEHHKGSKTKTATSITTTPNLTDTATNRTKVKQTDYIYGFDSNGAKPSGETITEPTEGTDSITRTGTSTTTGGADNNYTEVSDLSPTAFDHDKRSFDSYHIHGNIGTTQATQMLENELALRRHNLGVEYFTEFLNEYTFYADGIEVVK